MKILIVVENVCVVGGVERVVVNLANAFSGGGCEVVVFSFFDYKLPLPYDYDKRVQIIRKFGTGISLRKPKSFLDKLFREIKRIPISFYNYCFKAYRKYQFKQFIKQFNPDFIIHNEHMNLLNSIVETLSQQIPIKIVHNNFNRYIEKGGNDLTPYKNIILLTHQEIELFRAKYPKSNFTVIPNFIPEIPEAITDYSQKIVLSVGRMSLDNQKGFLRLIEIWNLIQKDSAFKEWKLHIVGDGELKLQIQAKIKDLGLCDSVILKPFTKAIEKEYLSASIYVMTSHFEGFGMVLAEAGSYGLPLVSFDIQSGPSEIIDNKKSGFLIQDNDLEDFAEKLKLLMQDRNLRENMGMESKRVVQEKFSKEVVVQQWMELFKNIKIKRIEK